MKPSVHASVALDDIQGIVRFGYKHHAEASLLLLRVRDRQAARAWLGTAPVTSAAAVDPLPATALQIALTADGLHAMEVPRAIVEAFSAEFVSGMGVDASRARRLGDVGANAPEAWRWGLGDKTPHVLLMLYALPGQLAAWQAEIETQCGPGFDTLARWRCGDLRSTEHFGFADGISQPEIDWQRQRPAGDAERQAYDSLACLGEFLLGYPNEYGGYTDRPLIDPQHDRQGLLPRAEEAPDQADLGRNGSYLVLRQLHQDVRGFWQWIDRQADGDADRREQLAACLVGRTRRGAPLVQSARLGAAIEGEVDAEMDLNDFSFDADPRGVGCPLGAHVRRANPRSADLPPGRPGLLSWIERTLGFDGDALRRDQVASTRFHRLLRRGRAYGQPVTQAEALQKSTAVDTTADDGNETGLFFVCLNANIARQFEFVQGAWLAGTHFNGLANEADPLLGTRHATPEGVATNGFSIPQAHGPDRQLGGLPPFVTLRGGAYFFLPGIRALRYLAQVR